MPHHRASLGPVGSHLHVATPHNNNHHNNNNPRRRTKPPSPSSESYEAQMRTKALIADMYLRSHGYESSQEQGQRYSRLKGFPEPPHNIDHITEVFIGRVPRDLYEDELLPILNRVGLVCKLRLMMDFSKSNRGFAYAKYTDRAGALRAITILKEIQIRPNHRIGTLVSFDNCKLHVSNIPFMTTELQLKNSFQSILGPVIEKVNFVSFSDENPLTPTQAAEIQFKSHLDATKARRVLLPNRLTLNDHVLSLDWARVDKEAWDKSTQRQLYEVIIPDMVVANVHQYLREFREKRYREYVGQPNSLQAF